MFPEGFEVAEKPDAWAVEDSCLNLKGKRLGPLKTEEMRLVLKPKAQGIFTLKPRILYLDEIGKYKTHEPEPITATAKELEIKGWLKGEMISRFCRCHTAQARFGIWDRSMSARHPN